MSIKLTLLQSLLNQIPKEEIENFIKTKLQNGAAKLDLISREEFDIQAEILTKTVSRLDQLEAEIAALTAQNQQNTNNSDNL